MQRRRTTACTSRALLSVAWNKRRDNPAALSGKAGVVQQLWVANRQVANGQERTFAFTCW